MNRQSKPFRGRRWVVDLGVLFAIVIFLAVFMFEFPGWLYRPLASIPPAARVVLFVVLVIYMFLRGIVLKANEAEHQEKERRDYLDMRLSEVRRHFDEKTDQIIRALDEIRMKIK